MSEDEYDALSEEEKAAVDRKRLDIKKERIRKYVVHVLKLDWYICLYIKIMIREIHLKRGIALFNMNKKDVLKIFLMVLYILRCMLRSNCIPDTKFCWFMIAF